MAIELRQKGGALELSKRMMKGDDGGYYIPEVNEAGDLSWIATEQDMPAVETVNIKGREGARGESGVYVGTTEPDDDEVLVWINPDGESSEGLATKEYVDEAIAGIEVPEVDLTGYAKTEDIPDVSGFQTEEQVQALIDTSLGVIENGSY